MKVIKKKIPKWGFGMAPISEKMQGHYDSAVQSMLDLLEGRMTLKDIDPDQISELKGMFNRCLHKDQWDWFSVYTQFGLPGYQALQCLVSLLSELRQYAISQNDRQAELIKQRLLASNLLTYLQTSGVPYELIA